MADIKSKEDRSRNMSAIKSKDTKPEMLLRKLLFSRGYRYRKNSKTLPGQPDIWMRKYNTAIFVNGCFWHRHNNCKYAYTPKSRIDFWKQKFEANVIRDNHIKNEYNSMRVKLLIVWECSIMRDKKNKYADLLNQITDFLNGNEIYKEI